MPSPTLTITEIAPDDEDAIRAWFDVAEAARTVDRPEDPPACRVAHRSSLAPWPGQTNRSWLVRRGGEPVGVVTLGLPSRDNLDSAYGDVLVAPDARRQGMGRLLLGHLASAARDAGRTRLVTAVGATLDGIGPGLAFATAVGAAVGRDDVQRVLTLPSEPLPVAAAPPGYRLVSWADPTPPEWLDDVAILAGRMSTDAPQGDLGWEAEVHDADRVRERDAAFRARGITVLTAAAVAPDGHLAGYTELALTTTERAYGHTWNTLVLAEHRGRGLGLWLKLANLDAGRRLRPELRWIATWNAESNRPMIAINEAIGFRPTRRAYDVTLDLT